MGEGFCARGIFIGQVKRHGKNNTGPCHGLGTAQRIHQPQTQQQSGGQQNRQCRKAHGEGGIARRPFFMAQHIHPALRQKGDIAAEINHHRQKRAAM